MGNILWHSCVSINIIQRFGRSSTCVAVASMSLQKMSSDRPNAPTVFYQTSIAVQDYTKNSCFCLSLLHLPVMCNFVCLWVYVLYSCIKVDLGVEYTSLKFCASATWCVKCKVLKLYLCCVLAILDFKKKFLYCYTCVVASGTIVQFILYVFWSFNMFGPAWTCAGLQYWIKKKEYLILLSNPLLKPPSQGL